MKAWVYQDAHQVAKHGADKASYYVGWVDPEGKRRCKSCGSGKAGKRAADKLCEKTAAELLTGHYKSEAKKTWKEFRDRYEKYAARMEPQTRRLTFEAFDRFEEIIKPARIGAVKTETIDEFISQRREAAGKKKGSTISPASINKELRHLKAALRIAHDWGYLPTVPKMRMLKEPGKLAVYVTPEHFAAIYQACDTATSPSDQPFTAADWWRGLMVMGYMTGWRISELLGLRKDDVDLEAGFAITRWEDNKGKRDERIKLQPVVVEHLRKLAGFDPCVFPWNRNARALLTEFARIQEAAGIKLPCNGKHKHTRFCYVYSFHDLRRAFATMNADRLTADALQKLMRHKSYQTTQRYIAMARQMDEAVALVFVPDVLKKQGSA